MMQWILSKSKTKQTSEPLHLSKQIFHCNYQVGPENINSENVILIDSFPKYQNIKTTYQIIRSEKFLLSLKWNEMV